MKPWISCLGVALLAGCVSGTTPQTSQTPPRTSPTSSPTSQAPQPKVQRTEQRKSLIASPAKIREFKAVVARMEPVSEQVCRERTTNMNCDFKIQLDTRRDQPPNAYQTQDPSGRPVLTVTQALLADVNNDDEMAFVIGHEASHHIRNHLRRKQNTAMAGAVVAGVAAAVLGGGGQMIDMATNMGGSVGARTYSKNYELEADALSTVITKRAGYDPVHGAAYFTRMPDPGDRFLGSHPPNAKRVDTVKKVAAKL